MSTQHRFLLVLLWAYDDNGHGDDKHGMEFKNREKPANFDPMLVAFDSLYLFRAFRDLFMS